MNERYTLKKSSDFRRLYTRGKSAVSSSLVVYCRRNRLDRNRFGFTVSKKLGKAVVRNRVRRRLREIARLNNDRLLPGYDIILVARGRAVHEKYRKLNDAYLQCCRELGIRKETEE